jgi:hypothetical protein
MEQTPQEAEKPETIEDFQNVGPKRNDDNF